MTGRQGASDWCFLQFRHGSVTIVAYLVTSHTGPEQVLRLVRTLRALSPAAPVLVHHDGRREPVDAAALDRIGGVHRIPPEPVVEWGRGSQLAMQLRCLAHAVERVEFDWLTTISGQDYPARPLEAVERDLATTTFDGFVEGHEVRPPPWTRGPVDEFARRYFLHWRRIPEPGRLGRRAIAAARPLLGLRDVPAGVLLGHRAPRTPFTAAMPCRRGSDWLTLRRGAAEAVVRAVRERPCLVAHFRRTVLPTEALPHTVLHAEPGLRLSGDVRRHTRWAPGTAHPAVLGLADLDAVLTSGTDFARKFDQRADGAVLDALDRALGV
jgi:hypothetical protein